MQQSPSPGRSSRSIGDTDARHLGLAIGAGRVAFGATALALPDLAGRLLVEPADRRPVLRMFSRLVGVRDLALGVATIASMRKRDSSAQQVLLLGAACDLVDGLATIRQAGVPVWSRRLTAAVAWSGAAASVVSALGLRRSNS